MPLSKPLLKAYITLSSLTLFFSAALQIERMEQSKTDCLIPRLSRSLRRKVKRKSQHYPTRNHSKSCAGNDTRGRQAIIPMMCKRGLGRFNHNSLKQKSKNLQKIRQVPETICEAPAKRESQASIVCGVMAVNTSHFWTQKCPKMPGSGQISPGRRKLGAKKIPRRYATHPALFRPESKESPPRPRVPLAGHFFRSLLLDLVGIAF